MPARRPIHSFRAFGHPHIVATHPTTLEFTTASEITLRGDCIIGVRADCAAEDLPMNLKDLLTDDHRRVLLRILVGQGSFEVFGEGSRELTLKDPNEMVVRKSGFCSDRTIMVNADKAARDIPRDMVQLMRDSERLIRIEFCEV